MRIRTSKNLSKKNTAITLIFLLPLIGTMTYGVGVLYFLYEVNSFTFELDPPDTDEFYPMDDINMSRLEEMAHTFDYRNLKFNSPVGYPVDVTFTNRSYSYNAIDEWHHTDNGALHNAYALAAACFRYKVALDEEDEVALHNASKEVRFFVEAMANLIRAPNGGLGINPDTGEYYPGVLSRFAVSYEDAVKYHPFMLEDHVRHHNGTGKYSDWRIRLKTSRDEVSGYYLGWSCVLKFIDPDVDDDSKESFDLVKTMVNQVFHHWKVESNWLVLDHDGSPTGSDINAADWQLSGLRIAATANPEKYESLYHYAASKMREMDSTNPIEFSNAGFEYYAWCLGMNQKLSLILLEDNPQLRFHYIKQFEEGMYNTLKYHRNAYMNTLHLVFMTLLSETEQKRFENPDYSHNNVKHDIIDQLWRFHTSNWCPVRNYNLTDRPHSTRSTSLNPKIREGKIDPTRERVLDFFENHPLGPLYSWMTEVFKMDQEIYEEPRTISEHWAQHMIWQSNPFKKEGGDPDGDGLREPPGTSYTLVYWLGRAFEIY